MTVTFFGHADAPDTIRVNVEMMLRKLIKIHGTLPCYVGCNGRFDTIVQQCLLRLLEEYPQIRYAVVLTRLSTNVSVVDGIGHENTIFPECLDRVPPKHAIDKRNRWMVERADCVLTYVTRPFGGAAKFKAIAEKKGKRVIDLLQVQIQEI